MKNFNIELTYQPINDTWSALIKHGNGTFLGVKHDIDDAIDCAIDQLFAVYPPVCRECGGTGVVSVDMIDEEGNILEGVGTKRCQCITNIINNFV
jgi:hypothetical protein